MQYGVVLCVEVAPVRLSSARAPLLLVSAYSLYILSVFAVTKRHGLIFNFCKRAPKCKCSGPVCEQYMSSYQFTDV